MPPKFRSSTRTSGLVEYGKVGLRAFMRADGELLYNDTCSPVPFVVIQNHS
jgi:hypothetical protein